MGWSTKILKLDLIKTQQWESSPRPRHHIKLRFLKALVEAFSGNNETLRRFVDSFSLDQLFIYRHVLAGHDLPHDMMTQDPGCGHGTASHCRINLTHVTIGPRRGGGLVTDGGLLTVILMQRATKVTLNTQHSTPQSCEEYFPLGGCRARAVARFGGVTPPCL